MTENDIARQIVDAAFRIHTTLGPGLLESAYHAVLAYELGQRGLRTVSQQPIPVVYGAIRIDIGWAGCIHAGATGQADPFARGSRTSEREVPRGSEGDDPTRGHSSVPVRSQRT